jgi:hypothetical protein
MSEVSLLPAPQLDAEIERTLTELTEHRMLTPARRAGYELQLVGATVLPQRQTISRTQWGTWLFVDHTEDPTAEEYGGQVPIPTDQLAHLSMLDQHGVQPDLAWIIHQLPATYKDGDPLPQLVPAPRHLREKDERLSLWLAKIIKRVKGAAKNLAEAGAGLDPVVLGGVKHPELPVVQWCVLAQWEWE